MRFELAGSSISKDPRILTINYDETFPVSRWIGEGYTHYEVICIGGGGGPGGAGGAPYMMTYGGGGGGGGLHRIQGYLKDLPSNLPIVVGSGGSIGKCDWGNWPPDWNTLTDGGDGGYTSFNGNTCKAGGGEGGHKPQDPVDGDDPTYFTGDGGSGGQGGTNSIGGGPAGGIGGYFNLSGVNRGQGSDMSFDGTWDGIVGDGGGGGAGGAGGVTNGEFVTAQNGALGSYNIDDTTVYGPGKNALQRDDYPPAGLIRPGGGGGAKATPLSGNPRVYGSGGTGVNNAGARGVVIIRLTIV